jgi:hypothetical protein
VPVTAPAVGRALFVALTSLALFAVAVAVLLAFTPLNELPDTYCQSVAHAPIGGDGCTDVLARRRHWIAVMAVIALVLAAGAVTARRLRGRRRLSRARVVGVGLFVVSGVLGLVAAAYLTIGIDHEMCGSTLSRVDPQGSYSPDRPPYCAPRYAASRADAWGTGLAALLAFGAGVTLEARRTPSERVDV